MNSNLTKKNWKSSKYFKVFDDINELFPEIQNKLQKMNIALKKEKIQY